MVWVDAAVQGVLLGGLYALFATGLSLIFGVMRLVNLAHGDFSILAAFVAVVTVQTLDVNPLTARGVGRRCHRGVDGHRHRPAVRAGDGAVARDRRRGRRRSRHPDDLHVLERARPAAVRLRGGDHRRPRLALGHARGRRHPRRRADGRGEAVARLGRADRSSRLSRRAAPASVGTLRAIATHGLSATAALEVQRTTTASRVGGVGAVLVVVGLVLVPWSGDAGFMRAVVEFIALLVLAQMWNLLAGYAGLVSVGQQAYVGLGGYALVVLADDLGVNPFLAVPLAGLVAAAFALPTAALVFRFRDAYFAVGTWAAAEVYRLLIANTDALGRGTGRTLKAVFPLVRETREVVTYGLAVAIGVAALVSVYWYLRSRRGLGLMAVRDSEPASASLGVDVVRTRLDVYVAAAFGTGTTGALLYLNLLRISPDAAFSINWTAYTIFIVVIGGLGTLEGPIVGTLLFFLLRHALADYGSWDMILLGSLAVLGMMRYPQGLWGLVAERYDLNFFPVQRRVRRSLTSVEKGSAR